jgi:Flp pilus assembly protein TadG
MIRKRNMRRDQSGTAAAEFALVLPVLIVIFVASMSLFDAFRAKRLISQAATTVVDLATRATVMNDNRRDELYDVAAAIAGDYIDVDDYEISVTSIVNEFDTDDDDTLTVAWSFSNVSKAKLKDKDLKGIDLPTIAEGDSMVLVYVQASYAPPVLAGYVKGISFQQAAIRRPRFIQQIPYK